MVSCGRQTALRTPAYVNSATVNKGLAAISRSACAARLPAKGIDILSNERGRDRPALRLDNAKISLFSAPQSALVKPARHPSGRVHQLASASLSRNCITPRASSLVPWPVTALTA